MKSIATQTGANSLSVDDYAKSFEGRLRALSYAHDQSFAGTDGGELRGLIEAEAGMHRFAQMPDRIMIGGDPVGLTERAFGVFALLLHEMMTNAAKCGSLSVPSGKLDISWSISAEGNCELSWVESEGPEVVPPIRRGFGSNLIEKTISHDLGGIVDIDFAPAGLRARIMVPGKHLHAVTEREAGQQSDIPVADELLAGLRVLLVEDQALIAMDTEELLRTMGASEVVVAADVETALDRIAETVPACAVLDLNLGSTSSEEVAVELERRNVPYVFATGYRDSMSIPDRFSRVPVVRKPVAISALAVALQQVIPAG